MPSLPLFNRFAPLSITEEGTGYNPETVSELENKKVTSSPIQTPSKRRKRWERRLPGSYTVAATPGANSLSLKVEIQTTDTADVKGVSALLDSGATGLFIDSEFVRENRIATRTLTRPIALYNVDGTANEAGAIREVVDLILRFRNHSERALFAVTSLGKQKMLLGYPWLRDHNPEVNWQTQEVIMTRCPPHCHTCREQNKQEAKELAKSLAKIHSCRQGPFPLIASETEEENEMEEDPLLEPGEKLFAAVPREEEAIIGAGETTSQRLAAQALRSLPPAKKSTIPEYLRDFEDVFAKESFDALPQRRTWDHAIELEPGSKPANCKVYPLSPSEQLQLDEFLQENLTTGRIRPSKSPMVSPVFFIKKKDGSLRLVQDYRVLNSMTVKNRYPIPLISDLINRLRGAKYFTKLDVRWGYNNVRIKEGDEWKAAFRTNRGMFEPLVMFFGLTNSPATFQTMMNDILQDLIMEGHVCVYLDDILIFTESLEEHRRLLRLVLDRLRKHGLYLRPEKCEFEQTRVEYLGLIVSKGKVEMDPVKVAGVQEWPPPKNRKEVQSFLGFANFYRRFIEHFSDYAQPLFSLTKKDAKWVWGESEQRAFEELKRKFTSAPILVFAEDNRPYRVEADSSDFATGAVLSQLSSTDEKWHPVAFYSKSLSPVERNYEIHDKEMLAIVRALEEWRHFLEGAKDCVEVWTDHKNLEYFRGAKKLNRRQARWSLYLSRFDFALHHRPGRTMGKSDALSRRPDHGSGSDDNRDIVLLRPELFVIRALEGIEIAGEDFSILEDIRQQMKEGTLEDAVGTAVKRLRESKGKSLVSSEWNEDKGLLTFRGKIYVPDEKDLRRRILEQHHDSRIAGHPGRWKTLELVSRNYWWPHMSRYVGQYSRTCDLCQRTKIRRSAPPGEMHALEIPENRWDTVSVDFIVELPDSHGYDATMNVVDTVSKRAHFIPTNTTITAAGAAKLFLQHVWKLHGLPRKVVSDRGSQFVGEFTRELYRLLGIKIAASTAYHPQTDGQTERVNQELEQYLRLFVSERQDNWDELLPFAEFQYNNHIHSSTRQTPFMLDTGRDPRMGFEPQEAPSLLESVNEFKQRMEESLSEAKAALVKSKQDMERYYNRRRRPAPTFEPGEKVFLDASDIHTTRPSRKLSHRMIGPYVVEERVGSHAYRLKLPLSLSRLHPVFHVVKLAPYPMDPIPGRQPDPPPSPILHEGEEHHEVERILDSRMFRNRLQFLIKWTGYGYEENSWENEEDVLAPQLIADFYRSHPGAPRRIHSLDMDLFAGSPGVAPVGLSASGRRCLGGG
jgi:hypothetical protein